MITLHSLLNVLCHPELVSGSGECRHEILKQVQDDGRMIFGGVGR